MCTVKILSRDFEKNIEAAPGEKLLDVLSRGGISVHAPCGGRGVCGKCLLKAEGEFRNLKDAPEGYALACASIVNGDISVTLTEDNASILADFEKNFISTDCEKGLGVAVDIGTTTLAAYLLNLENGEVYAAETMLNPQRTHGADVVSRISYALESEENAARLTKEIESAVSELTRRLTDKAGFSTDDIIRIALVGNTAMMHLAAGFSTLGISKAPFTPEYTKQHMRLFNGIETFFGGCVSGYVGADTLSCMLAADFDKAEDCRLLIDIGTNGEIALLKDGKILTCSCAAGPAFEGAHIACGTGAVPGAIDHAEIKAGKISFTTIAGKEACGICGSGLIDLVSALVDEEEISPVGRMEEDVHLSDTVYLSKEDIREVQLAKAAIASGIQILMKEANVTDDDISTVLLAGGFGNFISIPSACNIGLLPKGLIDKIKPIGNAAGEGARLLVSSEEARKRLEKIHAATSYIELAAHPDFSELYADNLIFGDDD